MTQLVSCGKSIVTHNFNQSEPINIFNPHQSNVNCVVWNHNSFTIKKKYFLKIKFLHHAETMEEYIFLIQANYKYYLLSQIIHLLNPFLMFSFHQIVSFQLVQDKMEQYIKKHFQYIKVKIWDLKKKAAMFYLKGHYSQVNSLCWNSIDSLVASCSNAGDIIVHDLATQISVANLSQQSKTPGYKTVKFSPLRKQLLLSGSNDGSVTVWDVNSKESLINFTNSHSSKVTSVAFSAFNENLICSSGIDQKVIFYDTNKKGTVQTINCESPLTSMSFHYDGHTIAVGTLYGQVMIYDLRMGVTPKKNLKGHDNGCINYLEFANQNDDEKSGGKITSLNNIPTINSSIQSTIKGETQEKAMPSEKSLKSNKSSLNTIEEIKRDALQRLEQQKLERASRQQSQKPPQSNTSIQQQQSNEKQSAYKESILKQSTSLEIHQDRLEDISKKYDKIATQKLGSGGFTDDQKVFLKEMFDENRQIMKNFISEQVGTLHIDMIRQFQIQQNDFQVQLDKYFLEQNYLVQRISQLEQQLQQAKRQSY